MLRDIASRLPTSDQRLPQLSAPNLAAGRAILGKAQRLDKLSMVEVVKQPVYETENEARTSCCTRVAWTREHTKG
jgi:hypothetical protein